jgi:hypothetical protein
VLAVLCGGGIAALIALVAYLHRTTPGGLKADDPRAYQIGLGIALAGMGHFVGLVLGLAGLFQRRRKVTAIVGTVLNALVFLVLAWVVLHGMAKRGHATQGATAEAGGIVEARPTCSEQEIARSRWQLGSVEQEIARSRSRLGSVEDRDFLW